MELQIQPNSWSCLPTAFAMVADILVDDIIRGIGHNGDEIINFDIRRGYHPQEIIDHFYMKRHIAIIQIEAELLARFKDQIYKPFSDSENQERISWYLALHDAVLTGVTPSGKRHAVAWCHEDELIYDPSGQQYRLELFTIENVYIMRVL